jgi:hypothetical protein
MQAFTTYIRLVKTLRLTFVFLLGLNFVYSQDTIIEFDVLNQSITEILPVSVDTSIQFDYTAYSIGTLGNQVILDQTPPDSNIFPGTNFSYIMRAGLFNNVSDYPFRTAIKLFGWKNDTLEHNCSGVMIGENFVMTAAHCLYSNVSQSWQFDSLLAIPAWDNGIADPQLPASTVEKIYIFKSYYSGAKPDDIALLKLNEPIGQQIGWIGMAFSNDTSYFAGKVFHKLSYPSAPDPVNPSLVYNGDTLYYNYGEIDLIGSFLGLNSPYAIGIPGQSGSSLFYTNNSEYFSFGVFSYAAQYRHYQITSNILYQFKNIISNNPASISVPFEDISFKIFPNPAFKYFYVEFKNPGHSRLSIQLRDVAGRIVTELKDFTTDKVKVDIENLNSGLYIVSVQNRNNITRRSRLIIK